MKKKKIKRKLRELLVAHDSTVRNLYAMNRDHKDSLHLLAAELGKEFVRDDGGLMLKDLDKKETTRSGIRWEVRTICGGSIGIIDYGGTMVCYMANKDTREIAENICRLHNEQLGRSA